jgi:hypothetical protein
MILNFLISLLKVKRSFWEKIDTEYAKGKADTYTEVIQDLEAIANDSLTRSL